MSVMSRTEIRFWGAHNQHGWLSNFAPSPLPDRNGQLWPTVEHAFQAMKSTDPEYREAVLRASTPAFAKRLGRAVQLRPDWNDIRVDVMRRLLAVKFAHRSKLGELLIGTGSAPLIEDSPNDYFWGCGRDGSGQNMLGQLLEERRDRLQTYPGGVDDPFTP